MNQVYVRTGLWHTNGSSCRLICAVHSLKLAGTDAQLVISNSALSAVKLKLKFLA